MGQVEPAKGTVYLLKAVAVDKYSRSHQGNKAFVGQQHQQRVGGEIEGRQYQHHSKNSHQQGWSENLPNGFALIEAKEAQQNTADAVEQNAVMAKGADEQYHQPGSHSPHRGWLQSAVRLLLEAGLIAP